MKQQTCRCGPRGPRIHALGPEDEQTLQALWRAGGTRKGGRPKAPAQPFDGRSRRKVLRVAGELEAMAGSAARTAEAKSLLDAAHLLQRALIPTPPTPSDPELARLVRNSWIHAAYYHGYTYDAMARVVGVTRERIRQLVALEECETARPPIVGARPVEDLPWPKVLKPWNRWPRPVLTEEEREELVRLHKLGSQTRGFHGPDDPRRVASEKATAILADMVTNRGFTYTECGEICGVQKHSIRARLKVHGYIGGPAPSQTPYGTKVWRSTPPPRKPIEHGTTVSAYNRCLKRPEGSCSECKAVAKANAGRKYREAKGGAVRTYNRKNEAA